MKIWFKTIIDKFRRSLYEVDWRYEIDIRILPLSRLPFAKIAKFAKKALQLFTRFIWWFIALAWIGLVSFIVLTPERASHFDILGTASQWRHISGPNADASTLLRNLGWLFITAIGLPVVVWRSVVAQKQANIAQMGQYADRFAKAVAMLGDEIMPVREAGIYALRELAISDPEGYYFSVQDLLCSFIRDAGSKERREYQTSLQSYKDQQTNEIPIGFPVSKLKKVPTLSQCNSDVVAALRTLSDLRLNKNIKREKERDWKPDLKYANFSGFPGHNRPINLQSANLTGAIFSRALFDDAKFCNAHLLDASFQSTCLCSASFEGATLLRANFTDADLDFTSFKFAHLKSAKFDRAYLLTTIFQIDELIKANIAGAWISPPIWPKENWPHGFKATKVKVGTNRWRKNVEYFTFIPTQECG